jgi:hypothetical protein
MLDGLEFEYGSAKERIAIFAKKRENRLKRLNLVIQIQAISSIGQTDSTTRDINQLLTTYSELLFPELVVDRKDSEKRAKELLKNESKKVLRVRQVGRGKTRGLKKRT